MSQLRITSKFYEYIFKKKAEEKEHANKLEHQGKEMDEQHTQQNMHSVLINHTASRGSTSIVKSATPAKSPDSATATSRKTK